jgi:hypothetical protein
MRGPTVQQDANTLIATISRVVVAANGTRIAKETVQSRYDTSWMLAKQTSGERRT